MSKVYKKDFTRYHVLNIGFGAGFTLIELLIVIAVIAIIATGAIVFIDPATQFKKANDARRKSDLSQIQKAIERYYQDIGSYPSNTTLEDLCPGTSVSCSYRIKSIDDNIIEWGSSWLPYLGNVPQDPGTPSKNYVYYSTGQSYYLYANLERGPNDPQICQGLNANGECSSIPEANLCGDKCNYGVSSPNVSP